MGLTRADQYNLKPLKGSKLVVSFGSKHLPEGQLHSPLEALSEKLDKNDIHLNLRSTSKSLPPYREVENNSKL